jgi:hypothetical protein
VTTIAGLAGPRVRSVEVVVRGRARTLPIAGGAFLGVLRGDVAPSELPVTVRYGNGRTRTFRAETGPGLRGISMTTAQPAAAGWGTGAPARSVRRPRASISDVAVPATTIVAPASATTSIPCASAARAAS